jgi:predicted permease
MSEKKFSGLKVVESLSSDLRQVWRQMLKAPIFLATVILMLACGFGVSIAVFSIVRYVLLSPLPYKDPGGLVQIVSQWPKTGDQNDWSAPLGDAVDWKASVPALQDLAMYHYSLFNLTEGDQVESVYGLRVTSNLLPILGVRPQLGNWFSREYDRPDNSHVIVLSDELWHHRFHSDPGIVGKTIHLNNEAFEVVAVMPQGFNFPLRLGTSAQLPTDQMQFWMPLGFDPAEKPHGIPNDGVVARLKPGVSLSQAQAQLESACALLAREYPKSNRDLSARIYSLRDETVRQVHGPLLVLFSATALIVLLTCANVASLLLTRGKSRAHELALRMALGGSALEVARFPMLEGILVCCLGSLLGLPVAFAGIRFLLYVAPVDVPRLTSARIDLTATLFAVGMAVVCGVLVGGFNALQVLKRSPRDILSDVPRMSIGRPQTTLRSCLVVGQVALAVILISSAGLMLRTFVNLRSTDTGYRADHVFYGITVLPVSRYPQFEQREQFFKQVLNRLRNAPGVEAAAVSTGFPLVGQYDSVKAQSEGMAGEMPELGISADMNAVSAGYLEAMGVRLISGRLVAETDAAAMPKVVVIDENLAAALWPRKDPLGQRISIDDPAKPVWRRVVGVVAPMRNKSLDVSARPGVFVPLAQTSGNVNFVVMKSSATSQEISHLLKDTVAGVDGNQGVFFIQALPDLIDGTIAVRRFLFILLVFFGGTALVLSTLGIYGLVSFIAASRTREVGIRMALGATRGNIGRFIVLQGLRLALLGELTGLIISAIIGQLISSLLYGVRSFDGETILFTVTILGIATTIGALIPAQRSARLQPITALRIE